MCQGMIGLLFKDMEREATQYPVALGISCIQLLTLTLAISEKEAMISCWTVGEKRERKDSSVKQ